MPKTVRETLGDAVARNSMMVLSLPSAGMVRHNKSRFLNENESGIWIEAVLSEQPLILSLITNAQPCAISYKTGDQKVSFVSKPLRFELEYKINGTTTVPALLIEWPAEVKTVQRRNHYRVVVPPESDLRLRVWRIPENVRLKDKPHSTAELKIVLRDISAGGVGVTLEGNGNEPPKVVQGERLRLNLSRGEAEPIIIEGRMLMLRLPGTGGNIRSGIHFQRLEEGLEGRRIMTELEAILGDLQRDEVRRHRLGIA